MSSSNCCFLAQEQTRRATQVWGQGRQPRGATLRLRSGAAAERRYPANEVRGSSREELPYAWGQGWQPGKLYQGKLEVVKQETARVNVDILVISELKWTGMGEFNSDDHYIYYCGQESLKRNGVAIMVNKRVWNAVLGCNLKNDRMISVRFQGKPFNITVIQDYAPTS